MANIKKDLDKTGLYNIGSLTFGFLMILILATGCATAPKMFDPNIAGPQVIVSPDRVSMGVANFLKKTELTFEGRGFEPNDSVFIKIMGVENKGEIIDIPIADGEVDEKGNFKTSVEKLVKSPNLSELMWGSMMIWKPL